MTRQDGGHRIAEAAVAYIAGRQEDAAMTTISSKNQITLPAQMLRELGIGPGDRLAVTREGSRLILRVRPKDWVEYHAGSLAGLYGKTAAETDSYVRELREPGERALEIERAWAGSRPASEQ
jgi:AbrB family looped-hinge helix DNA binding protein